MADKRTLPQNSIGKFNATLKDETKRNRDMFDDENERNRRAQKRGDDIIVFVSRELREIVDKLERDHEQSDYPDSALIKEAEKIIGQWKKLVDGEPSIESDVKEVIFRVADNLLDTLRQKYPRGAEDAKPFTPERFAAKVKSTIQDKVSQSLADTVKRLPGMATLDKFAQFAGLPSVSEGVNKKLGGALGKFGYGKSSTLDVAKASEQEKAARIAARAEKVKTEERQDRFQKLIGGAGRDSDMDDDFSPSRFKSDSSTASVRATKEGFGGGNVVRILTDIRDILAKQFNYQVKEDADDERDAASAEAKAELQTAATVPDYSYYTTPPASIAGGKDDTSPKRTSKKERKSLVKEAIAQRAASGAVQQGGGLLKVLGKAPSVAAVAGETASVAAGTAGAAGAGGLSALFGAVTSGLSGFAAALLPIAGILAAVAAGLYVMYNAVKQLELGKIFAPVIKAFKLLFDIVMTVGRIGFKAILVPLKILGTVIGVVLNPILKAFAKVLMPLVDGATFLWEKGFKPLLEGLESFLDWMDSWGFGGKDKKNTETAPAPNRAAQAPSASAPQGAGPTPSAGPAQAGAGVAPQALGGGSFEGLNIKNAESTAGGPTHPGVVALAHEVQQQVPGFTRFTSFNDAYHQKLAGGSKHKSGLAMDFTIADPSKSGEAAAAVEKIAKARGVNVKVIDEYKRPSGKATGGHIHVQFQDEQAAAAMLGEIGRAHV